MHLAQGRNEGELDSTGSPYTYSFNGTFTDPACSFSGSGSGDMTTNGAHGDVILHGYETDPTDTGHRLRRRRPDLPRRQRRVLPLSDNPVDEPSGPTAGYDGSYSADFATVTLNCHDSGTDWFGDSITESMTGTINVAGVVRCGLFTTDGKDGQLEKS